MRLKGRDYSLPGLYFVTICASQKQCSFGRINKGQAELTRLGCIVRESWIGIPMHFAGVSLHASVIMPNHLHGIIEIAKTETARHSATPQMTQPTVHGLQRGSLSVIIRSFKAEVSRRGREELRWEGRIWQPNYYDRIIRDGQEFADASRYIAENPLRWECDLENPSIAASPKKAGLAQHAAPLQGNGASDRGGNRWN